MLDRHAKRSRVVGRGLGDHLGLCAILDTLLWGRGMPHGEAAVGDRGGGDDLEIVLDAEVANFQLAQTNDSRRIPARLLDKLLFTRDRHLLEIVLDGFADGFREGQVLLLLRPRFVKAGNRLGCRVERQFLRQPCLAGKVGQLIARELVKALGSREFQRLVALVRPQLMFYGSRATPDEKKIRMLRWVGVVLLVAALIYLGIKLAAA